MDVCVSGTLFNFARFHASWETCEVPQFSSIFCFLLFGSLLQPLLNILPYAPACFFMVIGKYSINKLEVKEKGVICPFIGLILFTHTSTNRMIGSNNEIYCFRLSLFLTCKKMIYIVVNMTIIASNNDIYCFLFKFVSDMQKNEIYCSSLQLTINTTP